MIRRREKPDGLPFRVYERRGVRDYSIGYKLPSGVWAFRLKCDIADTARIRELRQDAIGRANQVTLGAPAKDTFAALADAWLARQVKLQDAGSAEARAVSTLTENRRELAMLCQAFGTMRVPEMEKADAYAYLDACAIAVDKNGKPRPRPEKGNKEIALARTILEYGVRVRLLKANPFAGVERLATARVARCVADSELALAVDVGRRLGGPQHIVALALKTAFLCVRRSVEVRDLKRDQIGVDGIVWTGGKRRARQDPKIALIEWSPELRATIDEALAIPRYSDLTSWHVFGNLKGQPYTKGGWKKTLSVLMDECEAEAARRRIAFQKFSLQECRPMGVSAKMERGDTDTVDATLHSSERMVRQVYDRRRVRVAKPAR
jgi:integrase